MALSSGSAALGFTTSGVAGGSVAAGIQAGIGSVAAGSGFAVMQSLAATGALTTVGVIGAVVLVVGLAYLAYK